MHAFITNTAPKHAALRIINGAFHHGVVGKGVAAIGVQSQIFRILASAALLPTCQVVQMSARQAQNAVAGYLAWGDGNVIGYAAYPQSILHVALAAVSAGYATSMHRIGHVVGRPM